LTVRIAYLHEREAQTLSRRWAMEMILIVVLLVLLLGGGGYWGRGRGYW
jgi:hypothetical protein